MAPPMDDPLLSALRGLEAELHHPGVRCSPQRLEELLHPDFHEVGRSGRRYTRQTVMAWLAAQQDPPSVQAWGYALSELADGCALLTYQSAHRAADGTRVEETHRASIWRRCGHAWQLFYHQGTPTAGA